MFKRRDHTQLAPCDRPNALPQGRVGTCVIITWCIVCGACLIRPIKSRAAFAAGVFACFTPFFGFHFFVAAGLLPYVMQGNILAALMSTFFGNPITYSNYRHCRVSRLGYWMLGSKTVYRSTGRWRRIHDRRLDRALAQSHRDVHARSCPLGQSGYNFFWSAFLLALSGWRHCSGHVCTADGDVYARPPRGGCLSKTPHQKTAQVRSALKKGAAKADLRKG